MNELSEVGPETSEPRARAGQEVRRALDRKQPSAGTADRGAAPSRRQPAELLTRGEYAELLRRGHPAGAGRADADADKTAERRHEAVTDNCAAPQELAESRTRAEVAEQARSGTGPVTRPAADVHRAGTGPGKLTHYAAEFKGQRIGLVTDGTHWAGASDAATPREATPPLPAGPRGHETGGQRESEETCGETISFEDRPVKVTGRAEDGIWVEGLPGEPPRQVGDLLVSPDDDERSRGDRLFAKAIDDAGDLFDAIEKNASLGFEALRRPPVHAEAPVPVSHHTPEVPPPPDAGNLATAALALGYLTWAASCRIHGRMRDSSP